MHSFRTGYTYFVTQPVNKRLCSCAGEMVSSDMLRERQRQRWEKEERQDMASGQASEKADDLRRQHQEVRLNGLQGSTTFQALCVYVSLLGFVGGRSRHKRALTQVTHISGASRKFHHGTWKLTDDVHDA